MSPDGPITVHHRDSFFSMELLTECSVSDHIRETGSFYELPFLESLGRILGPDTTVFDVGAHIGNHTIYFAGVLGLSVVAFEPNPEAFELLLHNIQLNGLGDQVRCINMALSDRHGQLIMRRQSAPDAGTMAVVNATEDGVVVEATLLDDLSDSPTGPVYVKVDVEGHETNVIRGGRSFIARHSPILSVEIQRLEHLDEVFHLLGDRYTPVDVHNATPTVVFRPGQLEVDRERLLHLSRYAVESALNYSTHRNWYLAERERGERRYQTEREGADSLATASKVLEALMPWLTDFGGDRTAPWIRQLLDYLASGAAKLGVRLLVVKLSRGPVPASLLSLLVDTVDLVDCDPERETPTRVRRFLDGQCVLDIEKPEGFGSNELGAAAVWSILQDGDEVHGPVDRAVLIGGEQAPGLELAVRSFLSAPYVIVTHDARYVFRRLGTLVGAAGVYLDDSEAVTAWDRSQILPAGVIDPSPLALARVSVDEVEADELGPALWKNSRATSRVLIVSYYAPPATPVSVHRLAYWHNRLPAIAEDLGYPMDVAWLTPTVLARGGDRMVIVEDRGPWGISEEWFERYRQCVDAGLDPLGISWCHYVEQALDRLGGPYTTVVLSGNPFHYFALGSVFRESFGSKIVLDFRDPFAYNTRLSFSPMQRKLAITLERQWVSEADAVISVNDYCLDVIAPHTRKPRYVIANGFDESLVETVTPRELPDHPTPIAYSGTVFAKLPLDDLLDSIPSDRFRLHHFGRDYSASQAVASHPAAVAHGLLPYEELISYLKACRAGIVMTSGEQATQTTKLFDYLSCDLDVIIVTNGRPRSGNLHQLTSGLDGIFWVANDPNQLRRFFRDYEPTGVTRPERMRFSRRHQTERLLEVIRGLEQT